MKNLFIALSLAVPILAQADTTPVINPRVTAVVTSPQDGRGNQFRATLIRRAGSDIADAGLIIEQLNYADGGAGTVLTQLDIEPTQWKWGADNTAIMGLTLTDDGFAFTQEPMTSNDPILHCVFALPEEPVYGPQPLTMQMLTCK